MIHNVPPLRTVVLMATVLLVACPFALAEVDRQAVKDLAVVEAVVRLDDASAKRDPAVRAAVLRHLGRHQGTPEYVELIETFDVREKNDELIELIVADPVSTQGAVAARLLLKFQEVERLRNALKDPDATRAVAVATALGLAQNSSSLDLLKPLVIDAGQSRMLRTAAVEALGRHRAGQRYLASLVRQGKLTDDLKFTAANVLLGSRDADVRAAAKEHLELPEAASSEPIPPVADLALRRGDEAKGKTIYATIGTCATCHQVHGEGKSVGPDLSEIGSKLSREAMYVSILDPSAGISPNFETYSLVTADGLVLSGVVTSQTDDSVTMKTAEAVVHTVARENVDELVKSEISLMPADIHKNLSVENMVDLVEYMTMLTTKGEVSLRALVDDEPRDEEAVPISHDPQDALRGLDVADGLEVTLFAAEPMLLSPSNIDVDHLGRVWVCEIVNYRHFRNQNNTVRQSGDRILVLEDTNGDGQADKSTVFYEGRDIDSPHGICVLGEKVIVSADDRVAVFTDHDGDLKADEKQVLFSGISGVQHDHGIHSFVFGPDGKLYFNYGNEGKQLKDRDGRPVVDLAGNEVKSDRQPYQQGMVFRCNLDGSELETLAWNFRNNWEVCVDSFGTLWQSDNDDDGNRGVRINYVMEYGNYGYCDELTGAGWSVRRTGMREAIPERHWHLNDPGVVPNLLQTGAGSPTGILVYEGQLLPHRFRNQIIHCDAGPNIVRAYPVTSEGAGYDASIVDILEGTRDKWFRPSDVCVAPDGSLIVADWYDPGVGGHLMGDTARGRLFRISPRGHDGYAAPKFRFDSPETAAAALGSPNLAVRYLAWRSLHKVGTKAEPVLSKIFQRQDQPRMRARALWLLGKTPGRGERFVRQAIDDHDANIRIVGIRLARQLKLDMIPIARVLVQDASPQVRREVAIAIRHNRSPEMARLWAELAMQHDGRDRWYLEALGISADKQWEACFEEWRKAVGDSWDSHAGRDIVWRSRAPGAGPLLAEIIAEPNSTSDQPLRYIRALDFHSGPQKQRALKSVIARLVD